MQKLNLKYINYVVQKALEEDFKPKGDITSSLLKNKNEKVNALIIAKQDGIIAGLDFCKAAFKLSGKETSFKKKNLMVSKLKKMRLLLK